MVDPMSATRQAVAVGWHRAAYSKLPLVLNAHLLELRLREQRGRVSRDRGCGVGRGRGDESGIGGAVVGVGVRSEGWGRWEVAAVRQRFKELSAAVTEQAPRGAAAVCTGEATSR